MIKEAVKLMGHTSNIARELKKAGAFGDYSPMRINMSKAERDELSKKLHQSVVMDIKKENIEKAHGLRELAKHSGAIIR
jgi:hypothetical protein